MSQRGKLFVIAGPSGAGKGTLVSELLKRVPSLFLSISATTRDPRPGDVDGVQYYFLSSDEFIRRIKAGDFLEWASVYDKYYGTLREKVDIELNLGKDVILEIDVQGARQIRETVGNDSVFIFIQPPSLGELKRRLQQRGTDSEDAINVRLTVARDELKAADEFDFQVINDKIDVAVDKLTELVIKYREHNSLMGKKD